MGRETHTHTHTALIFIYIHSIHIVLHHRHTHSFIHSTFSMGVCVRESFICMAQTTVDASRTPRSFN
jgi:hypothetical protein